MCYFCVKALLGATAYILHSSKWDVFCCKLHAIADGLTVCCLRITPDTKEEFRHLIIGALVKIAGKGHPR